MVLSGGDGVSHRGKVVTVYNGQRAFIAHHTNASISYNSRPPAYEPARPAPASLR
jgi:hypothetical protein